MNKLVFYFFILSLAVSCSKNHPLHEKIQPAMVERSASLKGSAKITLTVKARERLAIRSHVFRRDGKNHQSIPTSSLIYEVDGTTWVYVEPVTTEFHREKIKVIRIKGQQIEMESDISDLTPIVTQGAAELNGTEAGVGK